MGPSNAWWTRRQCMSSLAPRGRLVSEQFYTIAEGSLLHTADQLPLSSKEILFHDNDGDVLVCSKIITVVRRNDRTTR